MRGSDEIDSSDGGSVSNLKNLGGGKKTASVLDALVSLPTCISRPNLLNYRCMMVDHSSISLREEKAKAPSSTYNMQKSSNNVPSENDRFG